MKKPFLLITGATGFIGSHVVHSLLQDDFYRVVAIVRRSRNYKNVDLLRDRGVILIDGPFYEKSVIENAFKTFPVRLVLHLAALRGAGHGASKDYFRVNVLGTKCLLETALHHHVKTFIFCSSVGVFGTIPEELPASLATKLNPDNPYHDSKLMAEREVKHSINKGLNAYILRPTITYGSLDNGFSKSLVLLVKKRLLVLPSKPTRIHLLDVQALTSLITYLLKSPALTQRVFIVADENAIYLRRLANIIHCHYYGNNYPSFLRAPYALFYLATIVCRLVRNEKWSTRLLLMSRSWHYAIDETVSALQYVPSKTDEAFPQACLK